MASNLIQKGENRQKTQTDANGCYEFEIVDCNSGAYLRSMDSKIISTYSAGTFFKGLSRPWTGLHTMDAVRRDAGEQQVWFYTELTEDREDVIITLFKKDLELKTYTNKDLVEKIKKTNKIFDDWGRQNAANIKQLKRDIGTQDAEYDKKRSDESYIWLDQGR